MDRELKTFKLELKEIDEEEGTFVGYAATFSKKPDSYGDIIDAGAFKKTLKERKQQIKILWNHDTFEPIGKPIELSEDGTGLLFKGKLVLGVQRAREVLELMKAGVINEMSIGYNTIKETMVDNVRHLQELRLFDISPVSFAANPEATILGVKAEGKPYPHEHACRLKDPGDFESDSFRRTTRASDGKKYSVIMGKLEGEDTMTEQAYRYDREVWDEGDAKAHCDAHDGTFEAAKEDTFKCECVDCGHKMESKKHCADIECPKCGGKMRRAERPGPGKSELKQALGSVNLEKVQAAVISLQALLDSAIDEPEPAKATLLMEATGGAAELEGVVDALKAENDGFDAKEAERRIESILEQLKPK